MGWRPRPQGLGWGWGSLAQHLSGALPTPCPLPGAESQVQFIGVQQSSCQVPGIVLGAWGCTDVGDTGLALKIPTAWGEKTDLQKVVTVGTAAASTHLWCTCCSLQQDPSWSCRCPHLPRPSSPTISALPPGSQPRSPAQSGGSGLSLLLPVPDCGPGQPGQHRPHFCTPEARTEDS